MVCHVHVERVLILGYAQTLMHIPLFICEPGLDYIGLRDQHTNVSNSFQKPQARGANKFNTFLLQNIM